jgi:hypothetical protein
MRYGLRKLAGLCRSRAFAYGSLLALQAKIVWGVWNWKDLTAGDTSSYFVGASHWAESLESNLVWSPLYLIFYGSLQWISADPFFVTVAHRLVLVFTLDALVLALFRCLVPAGIAWLLAAWWVVLPINFDTLYEVHLFAAVPTLLAALVACSVRGTSGRVTTFGLLIGTALLVRNEFAIAASLWSVACLALESRHARAGGRAMAHTAGAYASALLAVAAIWGALYLRSPRTLAQMRPALRSKHAVNVCQIYAFGYRQRHDDWRKSPWTECRDLMRRDFGVDEPTLAQAIRRNPSAMLEHFVWNVKLIPAGIQLQLFNRVSGSANPDYVSSVALASPVALLWSICLVVLLTGGAAAMVRDRRVWWDEWLRDRYVGWVVLGCLTSTAMFVMVMQRPRPSYLFNESAALMALVGTALTALLGRLRAERLGTVAAPILGAVLLVLVPRYYGPEYRQPFGQRGQPLRTMVDRLLPFREAIAGQRFAGARFAGDVCRYVGGSRPCESFDLVALVRYKPPDRLPADWLRQQGMDLIYVDEFAIGQKAVAQFVAELGASRWQRVASGRSGQRGWVLLAPRA